MNIQTSKGLVRVRWQYDLCNKEVMKDGKMQTVPQSCTSCILSDANKEEISKVTIHRYFKDPENKPLARKTTFRLAVANFSKEDKVILWSEFLKSVRIK